MSIPNLQHIIEQTKADYPRAWDHCHHPGDPEAHDFIILAARRCYATNAAFGLNGKRGDVNSLSWDALNWRGDSDDPPDVIDVVGAAGGDNPYPTWQETNTTGAWVDPYRLNPYHDYGTDEGGGGTTPEEPEPPKQEQPPYPGDGTFHEMGRVLEADYLEAGRDSLDNQCGVWFGRVCYDYYGGMSMDESIKKHRNEWRAELGLPPA